MKPALHTALLLLAALLFNELQADTRHSTGSGNWNTASTWNSSGSPVCGDSVVIQAGHIISVTTQQNYTGCSAPLKVIVYGTLMFYNGSKLNLPCGSYVIVYPGGIVDHDEGLANSNIINICSEVEWNSNYTLNGPACLPATFSVCSQVLPIELAGFSAERCETAQICLRWQTLTETMNDRFELEHSKDASHFSVLASINTKALNGNSLQPLTYSYTHEQRAGGIEYYRLRQVDRNGASRYSAIISASADAGDGLAFLVFPGFSASELTAHVTGLNDSGSIVTLLRDGSGNLLYKSLNFYDEETAQVNIRPAQQLSAGVYFCSFVVNGAEHTVKVFVGNN
jgi:hypothetical protein